MNSENIQMTGVAKRKLRELEESGCAQIGVILVKPKSPSGRHDRVTVDNFGRVQSWHVNGSGVMHSKEETKFPVLDGLLTKYLAQGAMIKKQHDEWCLVAVDGECLAHGETISMMLCYLILRDA